MTCDRGCCRKSRSQNERDREPVRFFPHVKTAQQIDRADPFSRCYPAAIRSASSVPAGTEAFGFGRTELRLQAFRLRKILLPGGRVSRFFEAAREGSMYIMTMTAMEGFP